MVRGTLGTYGIWTSSLSCRCRRRVRGSAVPQVNGFLYANRGTNPSWRRIGPTTGCTVLQKRAATRAGLQERSVSSPSGEGGSVKDESASAAQQLDSAAEAEEEASSKLVASAGVVGGILLLLVLGVTFKDQIQDFLDFFSRAVDEWGAWGYVAYMLVYTGLEVVAVPAIPLTMTAGVIFGIVPGTMMVSVCATAAATVSFLIARYAARDKVEKLAAQNPKFNAIDHVIGKNGFKVVVLLRLSPLLPLAISNYLYGLTSVRLAPYVAGSFLGMLPGTLAYVATGYVGREVLTGAGDASLGVEPWQVTIGLLISAVSITYVGRLAKTALDELEEPRPGSGADS